MEKDIFPRIDLFPRVSRAARYLKSLVVNTNVQFLPREPLAPHGDHLPTSLREPQPEPSAQLDFGWDSDGNYLTNIPGKEA